MEEADRRRMADRAYCQRGQRSSPASPEWLIPGIRPIQPGRTVRGDSDWFWRHGCGPTQRDSCQRAMRFKRYSEHIRQPPGRVQRVPADSVERRSNLARRHAPRIETLEPRPKSDEEDLRHRTNLGDPLVRIL